MERSGELAAGWATLGSARQKMGATAAAQNSKLGARASPSQLVRKEVGRTETSYMGKYVFESCSKYVNEIIYIAFE